MLRPRGHGVKLIELALHGFLFKMLAVQRTREDAPQRVGELFERIGHVVDSDDSCSNSEAAVTQALEKAEPKLGLDPVVDANSRVLILGTLRGDASLRVQRYYSHGRNHFWTILERVYGEPVGTDYDERRAP